MKKHEPKYIEVEGIMRACYDSFLKTGNKAYSEIIALADAVPAADVQEVRYGRWIWKGEEGDSRFMCSVCHSKEYVPTCNGKPTVWFCCPNCGAIMVNEDD